MNKQPSDRADGRRRRMVARTAHRISRPCRPGRRRWNGYEIDENLKDEWLEVLNGLSAFDLISICKGHADERRRCGPHVNLRLKEGLFDTFFSSLPPRPRVYQPPQGCRSGDGNTAASLAP